MVLTSMPSLSHVISFMLSCFCMNIIFRLEAQITNMFSGHLTILNTDMRCILTCAAAIRLFKVGSKISTTFPSRAMAEAGEEGTCTHCQQDFGKPDKDR